jgi:NAD(P)-dependent dehydrogenase (short-subunit alcohol dehydrogenase family)
MTIEGKIALITGGSRGIGAAIAERLAAEGAKVAITYTKGADAPASVVKEIERAGGKAIAIQADATDADAGKAAVEKTVATFGRLDVLVNNAGTAIPKMFEETTLEEMAYKGDCSYYSIPAGGKKSVNAVWSYQEPFPAVEQVRGHFAFYPDRVDEIEQLAM